MKNFSTIIKVSLLASTLFLVRPFSLKGISAEETELRKALELVEKLKIERSDYQRKTCLAECKNTDLCQLACEIEHKRRVIFIKQDTNYSKSYLNLIKIWQK